MIDDLRTRIAAVLNTHKPDDRYDEWADCQCGHVGTRWDDHVADAVIAELGLQKQSQTGEIVNTIEGDGINYGRHRYVTDWNADDE
jgi:hypothetical protein